MTTFNLDYKEVVNNLVFFTGGLFLLDAVGFDEVITNAIGTGDGSMLKRSFASALILETVVLVGHMVESTSLNRLTSLLE